MAAFEPRLLAVLACPAPDHAPLRLVGELPDPEALICTSCGATYPFDAGVPEMLLEQPAPGPRGVDADQHREP